MKEKESTKISKYEKINEIFKIIKKYNVSNYEISQNTGISEAGLSSITNGITKNPRNLTVNAIYSYLKNKYSNELNSLTCQNEMLSPKKENLSTEEKEVSFESLSMEEKLNQLHYENIELRLKSVKTELYLKLILNEIGVMEPDEKNIQKLVNRKK